MVNTYVQQPPEASPPAPWLTLQQKFDRLAWQMDSIHERNWPDPTRRTLTSNLDEGVCILTHRYYENKEVRRILRSLPWEDEDDAYAENDVEEMDRFEQARAMWETTTVVEQMLGEDVDELGGLVREEFAESWLRSRRAESIWTRHLLSLSAGLLSRACAGTTFVGLRGWKASGDGCPCERRRVLCSYESNSEFSREKRSTLVEVFLL